MIVAVIFTFVFGKLAKMPSDGEPYPLWIFAAMLPWQFFAASLAASSRRWVGRMIKPGLWNGVGCPGSLGPAVAAQGDRAGQDQAGGGAFRRHVEAC